MYCSISPLLQSGTGTQSVVTEAATDLTVTPADNQGDTQDLMDISEAHPEEGATAAVESKTQEVWMDFDNFCKCFK